MNYLKRYNLFLESNFETQYDEKTTFDNVLNAIKRDHRWESYSSYDHHEYSFRYKIHNNLKRNGESVELFVCLTKLEGRNEFTIYLQYDEVYYYIGDLSYNNYNKRNQYLLRQGTIKGILDWAIKLGEDNIDYFQDREKMPSDEELDEIYTNFLTEEMGYSLKDTMYGYTNHDFLKSDKGRNNSYFSNQDPYIPKDHYSSQNPKLVMYFENLDFGFIENETDDLNSNFKKLSKRIEIYGYNVKSEIFITTRYTNGEWRPEEFWIVMELK